MISSEKTVILERTLLRHRRTRLLQEIRTTGYASAFHRMWRIMSTIQQEGNP